MRIQLASDLHLEILARHFARERLITHDPRADVLVLAGDIAGGTRAIDYFGEWPVPVIYVMGNHEAYGHDLAVLEGLLRDRAEGTSVRFLARDRVDIEGVRFLGCTLWTDYALGRSAGESIEPVMQAAGEFLADHHEIRLDGQAFSPMDALMRHARDRAWLESELAQIHPGPTVVVTHHAVHPQSVHPRYAGDAVNGAFVSDLGDLLARADVWLHGHVHDSFDYQVGRARVVVNPRGYARNLQKVNHPRYLVFENGQFDPMHSIEVFPRS